MTTDLSADALPSLCVLPLSLWVIVSYWVTRPRILGRYKSTAQDPACRAHHLFSVASGLVVEGAWLRGPRADLRFFGLAGCQFCSGLLSSAHSVLITWQGGLYDR